MIGVTIAIGDAWKSVAQRAANRMAEFTGLKCHVIDGWHGPELEHPAWIKCRICDIFPTENDFFYFDSDIWAMRPFKPESIFEGCNRDFIGVSAWANWILSDECKKYELTADKYITGGMFIFGREHKKLFDYALSLHPGFSAWFDQTPINIAIRNLNIPITRLPAKYCAEAHAGKFDSKACDVPLEQVVNLHFCSCGGRAEQVQSLQEQAGKL